MEAGNEMAAKWRVKMRDGCPSAALPSPTCQQTCPQKQHAVNDCRYCFFHHAEPWVCTPIFKLKSHISLLSTQTTWEIDPVTFKAQHSFRAPIATSIKHQRLGGYQLVLWTYSHFLLSCSNISCDPSTSIILRFHLPDANDHVRLNFTMALYC
jgi:hypothetical protein